MKTSEYVSLGHPDKVADYISEYILDRLIEQDPKTRYALEVQMKGNFVSLAGEVTTNALKRDYKQWAKEAVADVGYTNDYAFDWGPENVPCASQLEVVTHISEQSYDIARGVNHDCWGDQGIMFGMAVNSPKTDYMPLDYYLAKKLCQGLYKSGIGGLDIKTQVSVDDEDNNNIKQVIVAIPLKSPIYERKVYEYVMSVLGKKGRKTEVIINGTGNYIKHGSMADCGTTGRKLAVDLYGGNCEIGGGSPWTKDGTKADLSLTMAARSTALAFVLDGTDYIKVGLSCCIAEPQVTITVWDKHGHTVYCESEVVPPSKLIKEFKLNKPIYAKMCKEGLFVPYERAKLKGIK